ncbi:MAG: hypothetical protein EA377_05195 [Phycisphaerales bacterium]|nr:MAG: hypothetical protein EA377_05195 [Phycisphaerales bacterium]
MSQVSGFNPVENALQRNTQSAFSEMSSEDFIKIIFTELSNQDPFDPNDSAALLEQISAIRSIESDLKLTQQLESLVLENQLASAGNLIGKFVGGLNTENDRVAGYVVSVIREGKTVNLELDNGWVMPMQNVETIIDPSLFDQPGAPVPADVPPPSPPVDEDTPGAGGQPDSAGDETDSEDELP